MADTTENVTVKLSADPSGLNALVSGFDKLVATEKELTASFAKTNDQYERGIKDLAALEKQERLLIDLRKKESDPAALVAYNAALENTSKKIAVLRSQYSAELTLIDQLKAKQNELKAAMDKAADPAKVKLLKQEIEGVSSATAKLEAGTRNVAGGMLTIGNAVKAAGAIIAAEFAVSKIRSFAGAVIDTTAEMQGLRKAIDFISGGKGEIAFKELERQADTLGLSLRAVAGGFRTFSASIGDKMPLEQQLHIFEQLNMGLSVMKVSEDKAANAYLALSQMMSKGTVQAEELKGQLGDALPEALGFAAKAMGVTEAALLKMMEKGEIMASDFLPKFANVLEKTFAGGVADAATSLQASINRQDTAWLQLRETLGNKVEPAYRSLLAATGEWLGILVKSIDGTQLTVDQSARLSSALNTLKNALSIVIGLFFTMTAAGRAMATNFIGMATGVGNFTGALYSMTVGAKVGTAGLRSLATANAALNASLTALRGILAGLGIGLAIAAWVKLYEIMTKVDVVAERAKENQAAFSAELAKGKAEIGAQVNKLHELFAVLKDVNATEDERARAIATLNAQYGQYLNGLDLERATWDEIEAAENRATEALVKNMETKLRTELYSDQIKKGLQAKEALKAALKDVDALSLELANSSSFLNHIGVTGALQAFGLGIGGAYNDAVTKVNLILQEIKDAREAAESLRGQGIDLAGDAPTQIAHPAVDETKTARKLREEQESEAENLRLRLLKINQEINENTTDSLTERQLAELSFTTAIEKAELESHERRLAAQGKLTAGMKATIAEIQNSLDRLFKLKALDILESEKIGEVEERTQAEIFNVRQAFINGSIASEADMQAKINEIVLAGEKEKLGIIQAYTTQTTKEKARIQELEVRDTAAEIARRAKNEQNAFETRQRFLQQGDYTMQEKALKEHFARVRAETIAANKANGVETGPSGLTKPQALAIMRDELEAKYALQQDANAKLRQLGLTQGQQQQTLGKSIRQKEMDELEAYYAERISQAEKTGESVALIEAEKAQKVREIHARAAQQALDYANQGLSSVNASFQAASQIVTNETQKQVDTLTASYDASINAARIKAERDAKYYGEGSKQAKKSADDLAHIETEKAYKIQRAQEKGAKEQARIAEFTKAIQVAQAVVATASAIIKYLAMTEIFPANIALSVAAGVTGALQVATILSTPIPKYAEGTASVKGGVQGRDSVHALLMPGERVVTTAQNQEYWGALEAIRTKKVPANALNGFAMNFGHMASGPIGRETVHVPAAMPTFDVSPVVRAIQEKEHVTNHIGLNEQGFTLWVERQNAKNKMLDKRHSYNG